MALEYPWWYDHGKASTTLTFFLRSNPVCCGILIPAKIWIKWRPLQQQKIHCDCVPVFHNVANTCLPLHLHCGPLNSISPLSKVSRTSSHLVISGARWCFHDFLTMKITRSMPRPPYCSKQFFHIQTRTSLPKLCAVNLHSVLGSLPESGFGTYLCQIPDNPERFGHINLEFMLRLFSAKYPCGHCPTELNHFSTVRILRNQATPRSPDYANRSAINEDEIILLRGLAPYDDICKMSADKTALPSRLTAWKNKWSP